MEEKCVEIWEEIKDLFSLELLTQPLNQVQNLNSPAIWKSETTKIHKRFIVFRNQHFQEDDQGEISPHCRVTLELSDGGKPLELVLIIGEEKLLDWDLFLEGKRVGDSLDLNLQIPILPVQHLLSSWSGARKSLKIKVIQIEAPPFQVFQLPGKDFHWDLAPKVIPFAIFHCCQQIPWELCSQFLLEWEQMRAKASVGNSKELLELMTVDLLRHQLDHRLSIEGKVRVAVRKFYANYENYEALSRLYALLIERALADRDAIQPNVQFRQVCKFLVGQFIESLHTLLIYYQYSVKKIEREFAGKRDPSHCWCQIRLGLLEAFQRFLGWLSKRASFPLVMQHRKKVWKETLLDIERLRESLSCHVMKADSLEAEPKMETCERFLSWLQNPKQKTLENDELFLASLRPKAKKPFISFRFRKNKDDSKTIGLFPDGGKWLRMLEKYLSRVNQRSYPNIEAWEALPPEYEEKIDILLQALSRIGALRLLMSEKNSDDPEVEKLNRRMDDFRWSFYESMGGKSTFHQDDLEIFQPLDLWGDLEKASLGELRTCWAGLIGKCRQILRELLIGHPKKGGLLQDLIGLANWGDESLIFQLPLLWALLTRRLEKDRSEALVWLRKALESSKKKKVSMGELEAHLDKSLSSWVLGELLPDMHREMIEVFWQTYREVATKIQEVKNPNGQRVLRAFLRHGILYNAPDMIRPSAYQDLVSHCPASPDEVPGLDDLNMVCHADELLTLVARKEVPGSPSFEKEILLHSDQELAKQDQETRRAWRLRVVLERLRDGVKSRKRDLLAQMETHGKEEHILSCRKALSKAQRVLKEYEYRQKEIAGIDHEQDIGFLLDHEVKFIRQQSKLLSGKVETFLPLSLLGAYQKSEYQLWGNKCNQAIYELRRNYKQAHSLFARTNFDRLKLNVRPAIVLLPGLGQDGNCVQPRSPKDLGRIVLPIFRAPNRGFHEIILSAYGAFRFDTDREAGMIEDRKSLLGQYSAYRWERLRKPKKDHEKEGFNRKLSDRNNFRIHFTLFVSSEKGIKLKTKSKILYELFCKEIGTSETMVGYRVPETVEWADDL